MTLESVTKGPQIGSSGRGPVGQRLIVEFGVLALAGLVVSGGALALVEPVLAMPGGALLGLLAVALPVLFCGGLLARRLVARTLAGVAPLHPAQLFALPGRLALVHLGSWLTIGPLLAIVLLRGNLARIDGGFLVLLACGLAGVGTALAARVRATLVLMPLSAIPQDLAPAALQPAATLRRRLTLVLGGIVFFSSAFGLFAVFAMQREIVGYYVVQKGEELHRAATPLVSDVTVRDPCAALAPLLPAGGTIYWAGEVRECRAGAVPEASVEAVLQGIPEGRLTLPGADLEGTRFHVGPAESGPLLTLLLPRPEWTRKVLLVSLLFYTLLFLFSAYLAAQIARSLTLPIEALRRQLASIEDGRLDTPVALSSPDEIGQLALSADSMRRGLKEMVGTIRELNLGLEEKVADRTRQLALANAELQGALDRLKQTQSHLVHAEKMASLGRLMTGLAHELNNPVNAILNTIGPLRQSLATLDGAVDKAALARLIRAGATVERAAERTVELIHSMGVFSRAGEQVRKPADLNAAVAATWTLLQHRVDAQRCRVTWRPGELPLVSVVPGEISQVFMNLFANALDAVSDQRSAGAIEVASRCEHGAVVVTVDDSGPGIPPDQRPQIFEPFFTTREAGTGLGLAISHEVVRRHDGSLTVDQGPLGGARFTLSLPLDAGAATPPV
jgi:signal transduction histidine kinase